MIEITEGTPPKSGIYVAYVEECGYITAKRMLLMYLDGWGYPMSDQKFRGHVYGWVGPLPTMRLEEIEQ